MSSKTKKTADKRNALMTGASIVAAAAAALTASPALAQDTDEEEAIVVTGTRIPQPNLYTTSPVTQVTAEDITTQGVTRVEDLTNQLPQVFAAQGSNVANGATGVAQVNLRNLGAARTLVLIDGRRMGYGSPISTPADLNQIPGPLVERVEVLTGGASAVYGSDAIAGVVNFIMRDDFEGLRFDGQYGFYQHNNDSDDGHIRDEILFRGTTNPSQFQLPDDNVIDGYSRELTAIFGVSTDDGRGNITTYLGYRNNDKVLQRDRDYSACALGPASAAGRPYSFGTAHWNCGGSATSFPGLFTDFEGNLNPIVFGDPDAVNAARTQAPNFDFTINQTTGEFQTFSVANNLYNYGPLNYYQRPDERYTFGAFARYEVNPSVEVYANLMFSDYRSVAQIAPSGDFFSTGTINCDNPLLTPDMVLLVCGDDLGNGYVLDAMGNPTIGLGDDGAPGGVNSPGADLIFGDDPNTAADESADDEYNTDAVAPCPDPDAITPGNQCQTTLYIGRRNVEGGGRQDDLGYESYRGVIGVRGPLGDNWDYDVFGQYYRVNLSRSYLNDFSVTRLNRALDVIDADPGIGVDPQCRSFVDGTDPNCVPYDVFTPGGITAEALTYLQIPLLQRGEAIQQNVVATITGDTGFQSPWAESAMQAALGLEYRRDVINQVVDENFATGNASGQGGPTLPLSGETDVFEVFGEARFPIIEGAALAELVSIDAAYRYSDYSTGVNTDSYKLGLDWAPTSDIRFRGSYQRAVRAPNIIELFSSQGFGLFNADDDPCGADEGGDGIAPAAACIGVNPWQVTAGQYGSGALTSPAGQYNGLFGGNPNLTPEEADTLTLGFVFTPSFLPGFNLSVDYFNIEVTNLVSVTGATNTLNDCYNNGNLASCMRIVRNPGTGQLWIGTGRVEDLNTNIGGLETSGYDVNANYSMEIGSSGALNFALVGTLLDEIVTDPGAATGISPYDCAGGFGQALCGTPNPEWRHRFRVGWETPWNLDLFATWRYYGEVERRTAANEPVPDGGGTPFNPVQNVLDQNFDAQHYLDLAGNWEVRDNAVLRFGVNNVLDNDPPLSANVGAGFGNGNTYPQVYDALGRWVFVGLTVDF
jgi:outer membrane receptor protein involved in Fe transport